MFECNRHGIWFGFQHWFVPNNLKLGLVLLKFEHTFNSATCCMAAATASEWPGKIGALLRRRLVRPQTTCTEFNQTFNFVTHTELNNWFTQPASDGCHDGQLFWLTVADDSVRISSTVSHQIVTNCQIRASTGPDLVLVNNIFFLSRWAKF